ncbi:hypothetical protein BURK1_02745 [Burkholderiales bacterium]|nr:hypothetical protein BURK1_02745 [Burkholderiales bacterium]
MRRVVSRRFDFARSSAMRAFVLVSHAATLALVAVVPVDAPLALAVGLLVVALGARALRGLDHALAGLVMRSDGSLVALRRDGRATEGALARGSVVLPWFAAVAWRVDGERRTRVEAVPVDRVGAAAHRELRVLLRYASRGATRDDRAGVPASQARASMIAALSALAWPDRRWR